MSSETEVQKEHKPIDVNIRIIGKRNDKAEIHIHGNVSRTTIEDMLSGLNVGWGGLRDLAGVTRDSVLPILGIHYGKKVGTVRQESNYTTMALSIDVFDPVVSYIEQKMDGQNRKVYNVMR